MDVYSLLNDIADCGNVTQQHVHSLYEGFLANPGNFYKELENCYLKIIKNFQGTSKQHRTLFENVTDKFITFLIKKWNESSLPAQKTRKQISADNTRSFLLQLMQLFAEGLDSTQFATRICCGRHLFMILRCIPPQLLNLLVDEKTAYDMLNHTVGLFKNSKLQKTGKTQKGLAVKLGSYLQHIAFEERKQGKLKQAIIALKYEMVRTICEDDKRELRLDALTNTELNESTLPFIIIRIRDVDVDVRLQVFKKLMKNKNSLTQLSTLDLYQVVFDGLKSSNAKVVDQCEIYLQQQFGNIISQESAMQEEIKQRSARKSINPELANRLYESIKRFLSLFQIEKTLIFPNLYSTIMDAFKCIMKSQYQDELAYYFRDVLRKFPLLSGSELSFVKVLCKMSQHPEDKIHLQSQLNLIVDHNFPDGPDFATLFNRNLDILQFFELLQIAQLRINQEEIGRKLLLEQITLFISTFREMQCPRLTSQKYNEVYEDRTDSELQSRWFAQHHFEMPIIKSYYELLTPSIKVIKLLVTQQDEMVELVLQIIQNLQAQIIIDDVNQKEQAISARKQERQTLEEEKENLMKKKKQNLPSLQLNEQLLDQNEKALQQIQQEYNQLLTHNRNLDVHCLYLLDALFNQVDIANIEDKMFIKLKTQVASISERHKNGEDTLAKQLSFRCLGYIPLFGIDVGGSTVATLARILDQTIPQQDNFENPMTITALRSLLDALLMYNEDHTWITDSETYGKAKILQIIVKFAFKSTGMVQAIALEGLSKLLLHDKIQKPQVWIAQFLFLWFDAKLRSQELPLQILTSFLKLYITSSLQFLVAFEKGLEIYFSICCYLHYVKDHILNPQLFETQQWQEASMLQAALSGIKIISYKMTGQRPSPSMAEFKDHLEFIEQLDADFIGPQERFIMYLCKLVSDHNNIVLHKIITQVTKFSDFLEMYDLHDKEDNSSKFKPRAAFYQALILFLEQCIERLEKANQDVKVETSFLGVIREEVQQEGIAEGNSLRDAIMGDFDIQREDANQLVKEMKKNNLIIQGQKQVDEKKFEGESDSEDGVRKKRKQSSDSEIPVKKGGNKRRR